jgi:hypothetical protein
LVQEGDSIALTHLTCVANDPQPVPHESAACTALRLGSPVDSMKPVTQAAT